MPENGAPRQTPSFGNGAPDWLSMKLPLWLVLLGLGVGGSSVGGLWQWQANNEPRIRQMQEQIDELSRGVGNLQGTREEMLRSARHRLDRMDREIDFLMQHVDPQEIQRFEQQRRDNEDAERGDLRRDWMPLEQDRQRDDREREQGVP